MKILGAAAAKEYSFERCVEIGKAVNDQLVTIGSTLDHCHVPGRQNHDAIGDDVCVIGAGIHNEPVRPLPFSLRPVLTYHTGSPKSFSFPISRRAYIPASPSNLRSERQRTCIRKVQPKRRHSLANQQLRRPLKP